MTKIQSLTIKLMGANVRVDRLNNQIEELQKLMGTAKQNLIHELAEAEEIENKLRLEILVNEAGLAQLQAAE